MGSKRPADAAANSYAHREQASRLPPAMRLQALLVDAGASEEITVRVSLLRALMASVEGTVTLMDPVEVDLTCEGVGGLLGRDASVIREWCREARFPGAYKLRGKEWRIPRQALNDFQREQQKGFRLVA